MDDRVEYLGIKIHKKDPEYITDFSKALLSDFYLQDGETISEAIARPAVAFCFGDYKLAQEIYDDCYNGWAMYSSPVFSNAPKGMWDENTPYHLKWFWEDQADRKTCWKGSKPKAMNISCFLMDIPDDIEGQIAAGGELAALSVAGGGVGLHNSIRAASKKAPGPIPYLKTIDAAIGYYRQSSTRRGSCATYMDVSHPDIMEFIKLRIPSQGDSGRKSDNRTQFHNAVNFTDEFIDCLKQGKPFALKCPHTGEVKEEVNPRDIWEAFIEARALTGEPYMFKKDTANRALPETQKALGLRVKGSNLCVSGDTKLLTRTGEIPIQDIVNTSVEVWNGDEWSFVNVRQTGLSVSCLQVELKRGSERTKIICTPEHIFYVVDSHGDTQETYTQVEAKNLRQGMVTPHTLNPELEFSHGWEVISISQAGEFDTYCVNEPKRHMVFFNGVLTGNCNEIDLPTDSERTAVCCLSSLNLEYWQESKDTGIVGRWIRFLDNVLQWFIDWAPESLNKAVYSARKERAVGLGTMGWHYYLQRNGIPFEGGGFNSAIQHTNIIFSQVQKDAEAESRKLAEERGEPDDMVGSGLRNSRRTAIAPNSNNSIILNTSPAIEPLSQNIFPHSTRAGTFLVKNKYLEKMLEKAIPDPVEREQEWQRILKAEGSSQESKYLTEEQKQLTKTAFEMDQHWIVEQADHRQKYLCMSQSLNTFWAAGVSAAYFNSVHLKALFSEYVKGMYYARMSREVKVSSVKDTERKALQDWSGDVCLACEG